MSLEPGSGETTNNAIPHSDAFPPPLVPDSASPTPEVHPSGKLTSIKIIGVGSAGIKVIEQLIQAGLPGATFAAINSDAESLAASSAAEKLHLDTRQLAGLGTGGDPERGRQLAEDQRSQLKALCERAGVVVIVTGLGGGAGTGISPVLAGVAKETGALTLAFAAIPFDCEGSRRRQLAELGFEELQAALDGVICLPNQKILKLIDENTTVVEAFKLANNLLADGVRGIWRLLAHPGLVQIHFDDICAILRDRHAESFFATAEAVGLARSREVVDRLLAHPLLEGGQILKESDAVLVSLLGGPDLAMVEVNRVMEQINQQCPQAQVIMGAAIDESFRKRLAVTVIASCKAREAFPGRAATGPSEELSAQLLKGPGGPRPGSRFVAPAPTLSPQKIEQLKARQAGVRGRKQMVKLRQTQLQLEIVSKGRFDKSEPTIHKGEDLDIPTYIRRGVSLNLN
jgi:cell division protein FtsZ